MKRVLSIWLPLLAFALFLLFPFYWMVLTSIKPNDELVSVAANPFWVSRPTLDHVRYLLSATSYPRWFWNTMAVAAAATALSVCVSFFAAVALARLGFRGAETVSLGIYLAYLIPPAILFIPLAEVMLKLGWFDRLWALVPVYSTFLVPFCTWLLVGYLKTIPRELEEAAMVDGASRLRIVFEIIDAVRDAVGRDFVVGCRVNGAWPPDVLTLDERPPPADRPAVDVHVAVLQGQLRGVDHLGDGHGVVDRGAGHVRV